MLTHKPLYELARPTTLDDVIGQPKAISALRARFNRYGTYAGKAYWISGASGTGKTTIARILAESVAEPICITEYRSGRELDVDETRRIGETLTYKGFGKGGRAYIINEAHHLTSAVRDLLLGIIEPVTPHGIVIFTTTREGEESFEGWGDASPFSSRVTDITLTNQGLSKAFAERAQSVAIAHGLDGGADLTQYEKLAKRCKNNLRKMLELIEDGCMLGLSVAA
jgi:replication-associated recombination protein RarA